MSLDTAKKALDFIFSRAQNFERVEIGFFGGEPLLEFGLIKAVTALIHEHPSFNPDKVRISITTNGTIFTDEIASFLREEGVVLCISCDGPPEIQNLSRCFPNGKGSSSIVEKNIREIVKLFPLAPVNAVYSPSTLQSLPQVIDYFVSLGVSNIYLSPNISTLWAKKDADLLPEIYNSIGEKYLQFYNEGKPKHISIIDGKISTLLSGGYQPFERCQMGSGEFAFTASGNIYPCERLVGSDDGETNCIGNLNEGLSVKKCCSGSSNAAANLDCKSCGIKSYCMNWCGCTNYYSTGRYDIVGPFMCASEKALITTAFKIIKELGSQWSSLSSHLLGTPLMNIIGEAIAQQDAAARDS
jgi:uncharacterized protein